MSKEIIDVQFDAAIREAREEAQFPLTKEVIETWLADYESLWYAMQQELGNLPVPLDRMHSREMCEFYAIYYLFEQLKEYYRLEVVCLPIMEEYRQIMANSPVHSDLVQWTLKHKEIGLENLIMPPVEGPFENFVRTRHGVSYFVAGSDFENSMDFYYTFSDLFWKQEILPHELAEIEREMNNHKNQQD